MFVIFHFINRYFYSPYSKHFHSVVALLVRKKSSEVSVKERSMFAILQNRKRANRTYGLTRAQVCNTVGRGLKNVLLPRKKVISGF